MRGLVFTYADLDTLIVWPRQTDKRRHAVFNREDEKVDLRRTEGMSGSQILEDLRLRGLIHDCTDVEALRKRLDDGPITVYCGFDPTADSLHIGHLAPLLLLRRFQDAGHTAIALAGGATGMIGDPSGRSEERNLLDKITISSNIEAVSDQLRLILRSENDLESATETSLLVDNLDWTAEANLLGFLRDVGKHVTVGTMLAKDSVRSRLEGDRGISFTEFSYMLLQANDFYELNKRHGCELQIGGSDQWGNITAGIDLIRRRSGETTYGLTVPLLTRSDGAKFGKTAEGSVWLDSRRTLPYELHQYFLNVDDRDVEQYLLRLTLVSVTEVAALMAEHLEYPEERRAQSRLADEVCDLIHGTGETGRARLAAEGLFGATEPTSHMLEALRGIVPESEVFLKDLVSEDSLLEVLVSSGLCSSKGDARRTVDGGGIKVNGIRQTGTFRLSESVVIEGGYVLLQKGKRSRHLLVVVDK